MLVMQRLHGGLAAAGCRVIASLALSALRGGTLGRLLPECDLVVVNGEGTLHHDGRGAEIVARAVEQCAAAGRPVALINSVWEGNRRTAIVLPLLAFAGVRESRSGAAILAQGRPVEIVPDLLLSAPAVARLRDIPAQHGALAVFDHVNPSLGIFLARFAGRHRAAFWAMAPRPPLRSLRTFFGYCRFRVSAGFPRTLRSDHLDTALAPGVVVTGRFHGACLAIAAGRPFVAITSNTHKIEGMLDDARLGEGAVVLAPPPGLRGWGEVLDGALQQIRAVAADPRRAAAYREACVRYASRATADADRMFAHLHVLAAGARVHR